MSGKFRNALDVLMFPPSTRRATLRARSAARGTKTSVVALAARLFVAGAFVVGQPVIAEPTPDISVRAGGDAFAALQDFVRTQRVVSLNFAQAPKAEQPSAARDPYTVLRDFVRVADGSGTVPLPVQGQGQAPDDAIHAKLHGATTPGGDAYSVLTNFVQDSGGAGAATSPGPAQGPAPDDAIHAGLHGAATPGADAYSVLRNFVRDSGGAGAAASPGPAPDDAIHAKLHGARSGGDAYAALTNGANSADASGQAAPADAIHSGLKASFSTSSDDFAALRAFAAGKNDAKPIVVALAAKPVRVKKPGPAPDVEPAADMEPAAGAYAKGDPHVCLGCHGHDPHVVAFLKSPMAAIGDPKTPMAQGGCESCHGPSAAHVASRSKGGDVWPAIMWNGPLAAPVEELNAICLGCHEGGQRINWQGSAMQRQGVACVNCHTVMAAVDPVRVKKTQPEVCFACHAEQRAQTLLYSHHPIREGLVSCSDCHNPHGGPGEHALKEFTVNETCYNCHPEKRGPLLWEHQPVREACTNCHTPHGSVEQRLMRENMGFLCSSCHSAVTNSSGGAFGGAHSMLGNLQGAALFNSALSNQRLCLNCHSAIHGSNSPNGAYFLR